VFFRIDSLRLAFKILKKIVFSLYNFNITEILDFPDYDELVLLILVLFFVVIEWHFRYNDRDYRVHRKTAIRRIIYVVIIFLIIYHYDNEGNNSFIYFQF
jgi:hypothetical protein